MKWLIDLFKLDFSTKFSRRESMFKMGQIAVLLLVTLVVLWIPYRWITSPGTDQIRLQIADAKALEVDAPVTMLGMEIGRVESIVLEEGRALAMLEIDGRWSDEIPAGSEFAIGSLNTLLPGNVGVRILPPAENSIVTAKIQMRDGIRREVASDRFLPWQTPVGLYIAIGVAALVFAITLGIAIKIAKSALIINLVIAMVIAGIAYVIVNGLIPVDIEPLRRIEEQAQQQLDRPVVDPHLEAASEAGPETANE